MLGGITAGFLVVCCLDAAFYSWDDWAALFVRWTRGPVVLNLVNATSSSIPVVDVGVAGFRCQATCVGPGERRTCRPQFRAESAVLVALGGPDEAFPNTLKAPRERVSVYVTWRSHGSVDLVITDAGVVVRGALSDAFP